MKSKVEDFSKRFTEMSTGIRLALEQSNTASQDVVLLLTAPSPYLDDDDEHMEFLETLFEINNIKTLFNKLNKYWNYLNYYLLERLIMAHDIKRHIDGEKCEQLQGDMKQYIEDMIGFRQSTTIGVYCKTMVKKKMKLPEGFEELVTECHEWSKENTLQDVEDFRQEVAQEYKLHRCLIFFKRILFGSVIIIWWIPIVALPPPPTPGRCTTEGG